MQIMVVSFIIHRSNVSIAWNLLAREGRILKYWYFLASHCSQLLIIIYLEL